MLYGFITDSKGSGETEYKFNECKTFNEYIQYKENK